MFYQGDDFLNWKYFALFFYRQFCAILNDIAHFYRFDWPNYFLIYHEFTFKFYRRSHLYLIHIVFPEVDVSRI